MAKSIAKPLYRNVIADAWHTTWQNKSLWVWGLFAALLGNEGEYQILQLVAQRVSDRQLTAGTFQSGVASIPAVPSAIPGLFHAFFVDPKTTFILLLIALIIIAAAIFVIWLTAASVVALITGTADTFRWRRRRLAVFQTSFCALHFRSRRDVVLAHALGVVCCAHHG